MTASLQEQAVRERRNIVGSATLGWICCAQHIHPSGDPTPSAADIDITRKIAQAGRELGVTVHDHLVIARGSHTSFRAEGLL